MPCIWRTRDFRRGRFETRPKSHTDVLQRFVLDKDSMILWRDSRNYDPLTLESLESALSERDWGENVTFEYSDEALREAAPLTFMVSVRSDLKQAFSTLTNYLALIEVIAEDEEPDREELAKLSKYAKSPAGAIKETFEVLDRYIDMHRKS